VPNNVAICCVRILQSFIHNYDGSHKTKIVSTSTLSPTFQQGIYNTRPEGGVLLKLLG